MASKDVTTCNDGIAIMWLYFYTYRATGGPEEEWYQSWAIYAGPFGESADYCDITVRIQRIGGRTDLFKDMR